jgi:polyisoprenyl-phosphate glycosyltransferase
MAGALSDIDGLNMPLRQTNLLSIVVPCHNEQEVLTESHTRLLKELEYLQNQKKISDFEVIYVDNGSTDDTLQVLKEIFENDRHVRIVSLRRNFGYQGSISAGLYHVRGDAAVTIDADLQDPPEKIREMIAYYSEGYDLVLGVRDDRSTDSFLKRVFSEAYYKLIKMMGVEVVHNHGDFRLMAKGLVDEFNVLSERNRFIRAMILQLESRYALVSYKREVRTAGKSKFNINSLFSLSFDGIVSFSFIPLRFAALAGLFMCILVFISGIWVLYTRISTNVIPGWASTLLPVLGLGGFQLLIMGVMGEYIGRLYVEVKQRPLFVVRKEFTHEEQ